MAWRVPDGRKVWPGMHQMAAQLLRFFGCCPIAGVPPTRLSLSWGCGADSWQRLQEWPGKYQIAAKFGLARARWPQSLAWHVPDCRTVWPGMCQMAAKFGPAALDGRTVARRLIDFLSSLTYFMNQGMHSFDSAQKGNKLSGRLVTFSSTHTHTHMKDDPFVDSGMNDSLRRTLNRNVTNRISTGAMLVQLRIPWLLRAASVHEKVRQSTKHSDDIVVGHNPNTSSGRPQPERSATRQSKGARMLVSATVAR